MRIYSSKLFKLLMPKFIRKKFLARRMRNSILKYYEMQPKPHFPEIEKVLGYLKYNPVTVFPYNFNKEYIAETIEVFDDQSKGLRYVLLDGKRLYFKKKWSKGRIRKSFNGLLMEQDKRCPHCYESDHFKVESGDVVLDIGAAEGNFALSVVEKASRIILFESGEEWVEALEATFEPWKHKVQIVNKFVGNVSDKQCTTLDDFFSTEDTLSFLKIDVEGAESQVLDGCNRIFLERPHLKVAICTYHKKDDEQELRQMLEKSGFQTAPSDGFMFLYHENNIKPPYLRRGLLRAGKTG